MRISDTLEVVAEASPDFCLAWAAKRGRHFGHDVGLPNPSISGIGFDTPHPGVFLWSGRLHQNIDLHAFATIAGLSGPERQRLLAFRFRDDALGFGATHGMLRIALGAMLGCSPADVHFRTGRYGKPALDRPLPSGGAGIHFSLSHCGALAAVILSTQEVGVDVEFVRDIDGMLDIAERNFPAEHVADILGSPHPRRAGTFLRYWCLSEAVSKASGLGLRMGFDRLALSADDPPCLLRPSNQLGSPAEWRLSVSVMKSVWELNFAVASLPTRDYPDATVMRHQG